MASKLGLFNAALRIIGETKLASVTEATERRYKLDDTYDGSLALCLENGYWNFALRTLRIDANPSVETTFGFGHVFDKPTDWVRTAALTADEYLRIPLLRYEDATAYWFADVDPIYVQYVSNDESYGMDLGAWPQSFTRYVEYQLASDICEGITQNSSKGEGLEKLLVRAKRNALNKDAMNEASPRFPPTGSWVMARGSGPSRGLRN